MLWRALLLETHLLARAVDSFMSPPVVRPNASAKFLSTLAFVIGVIGAGALSFGSYLWLTEIYPLRTAVLIMGGAGLGIALLCCGAAWAIGNYRYLHGKVRNRVIRSKVENVIEAASEEFGDVVRAYPKTAAALAALAGLTIANQINERGGLNEVLSDAKDRVAATFRQDSAGVH